MADVVLNQEGGTALFSGNKKVITHYNNVSDSSGATTKILDISDYSNVAGSLPVSATLNKIWYSVSVTAKVDALRMSWDNSGTDPIFLTLEGDGHFDYSSIGGIKNNEASNFTGDVNVTLPACTAGDSASVTCEWILNY
tara:strand:+ start:164 stop:580 length:417 start_codon:yes stop_codon:yes gene_type:complete